MKIKNLKNLTKTSLRKKALQIAEAGLEAIDTGKIIKEQTALVKREVRDAKRVFVVGVGKCSLEAGRALEKILGPRLTAGIVIDVRPGKLKKLETRWGSHPFPTQKNIDHTKAIIKLLAKASKNDLVIFIISGGGSTLLCQPTSHTCLDEKALISCLYHNGATIRDVNIVRKHLSLARGGYLAKYAYPARSLSLIFSDVPGNKIEWIASGPTARDSTTVADAKKILRRYDAEICSDFLEKELIETPKDFRYFRKVKNVIVATNQTALNAMAQEARRLALKTKIVTKKLTGDADAVGRKIMKQLHKTRPNSALLFGGETTVKIKGKGKGGRNMELALSALNDAKKDEILIPFASDGRDNSDIAGGICDIITGKMASQMKLKPETYLNQNDSYNFFKKTGQYLFTGDTGSNVSDLIVAIKTG